MKGEMDESIRLGLLGVIKEENKLSQLKRDEAVKIYRNLKSKGETSKELRERIYELERFVNGNFLFVDSVKPVIQIIKNLYLTDMLGSETEDTLLNKPLFIIDSEKFDEVMKEIKKVKDETLENTYKRASRIKVVSIDREDTEKDVL